MDRSQDDSTKLAVMAEQVTNIKEDLKTIKSVIRDFLVEIRGSYLKKEELGMVLKPLDERVSKLERALDWAIKLLIGGIVLAVLRAVLK